MTSRSKVMIVLGLAGLMAPSVLLAQKTPPSSSPAPDPPSICDSVAGNLVQNCGFETGNFTNWTLGANTSDQFVSGGVIANSGSYGAAMGAVVDNFAAGNSVSQLLSTVAGDTYNLDYHVENTGGGINGFEALWNGSVIAASVITNSGAFGYTEYYFTGLLASSSSTSLEFDAYQQPAFYGLDDVSVVTPEPSSILLMGSGLLTLGSWVRRRIART
jgi:PEP-CTERM motif